MPREANTPMPSDAPGPLGDRYPRAVKRVKRLWFWMVAYAVSLPFWCPGIKGQPWKIMILSEAFTLILISAICYVRLRYLSNNSPEPTAKPAAH